MQGTGVKTGKLYSTCCKMVLDCDNPDFEKKFGDTVLLVGPLIPLFSTSSDVCLRFQS